MEENKQITIKDVLMSVIDRLNEINVPMKYKHTIADQIEYSISDLQACVEAIVNAEKAAKEEINIDEPVIEIIPDENEENKDE